ncbi:unnamed protein product, partial [Laminaria digitata]
MLAAGRGYGLRRAALSISRCSRSTAMASCRPYVSRVSGASARARPGSGCLGATSAQLVRHRSEGSAAVPGSLASDVDGVGQSVGLETYSTKTDSKRGSKSSHTIINNSNRSSSTSGSSSTTTNTNTNSTTTTTATSSTSSSTSSSGSMGTAAVGLQKREWLEYQKIMQGRAGLLRRGSPTHGGRGHGHAGVGARGGRFHVGARNASNTAPSSRDPTTAASETPATATAAAPPPPPPLPGATGRETGTGLASPLGDEAPPISRLEQLFGKPSGAGHAQVASGGTGYFYSKAGSPGRGKAAEQGELHRGSIGGPA